ncbi:hypothetical protein [Deinococcus yavapaiensis]|uniref:Uncharacterized protein n=1 Tax=Deinococcus yavapaiensis KR-236 TaxID=694435 RepID=A0A318S0J9_9DEIO|nr:hypothetical protein [Deinococcus yavapaiensis]PYE50416.1 hypothetical protein DES52_11833 [Deinococcus yavapaiensis KR-236]
MSHLLDLVTCRWVPGTLDRVRVSSRGQAEVLDIGEVERRFGRAALEALYLKGHFTRRDDVSNEFPPDIRE